MKPDSIYRISAGKLKPRKTHYTSMASVYTNADSSNLPRAEDPLWANITQSLCQDTHAMNDNFAHKYGPSSAMYDWHSGTILQQLALLDCTQAEC